MIFQKMASQLSGLVIGNVTGGNTSSTILGAETAKSAVKNNFLSQHEYAKLNRLVEKKNINS